MLKGRRPWREELEIIDRTMKTISGISDPEELVHAYFDGIGDLLPVEDYVSISRRGVAPPFYRITRSSRFTEHLNPFTQGHRLPVLSGGILGEVAYANRPVMMDDLATRLREDDPAWFYLQGFESLIALPQYDQGEGMNVTMILLHRGIEIDHTAIPMLHWQSGLFGRGTHNLVLRNQLSAALGALDAELKTVGEIQQSLLPQELPRIPGVELAAHYQTSARAGGDYYDFFPLSDGAWGIFIGDVSGHGTPAAVLMAITHAIAHAQPGTHAPPAALLGYLNDRLTRSYTRSGTFVTAFYAVLDPATRRLTYARAGHNPPRLVRGGQVMSLDEIGTLPMGILEGQRFDQASVELHRGDLLMLYTDGITEAKSARRGTEGTELFGVERLDEVIKGCAVDATKCVTQICRAVDEFTAGAAPTDDRTLIAMRCL